MYLVSNVVSEERDVSLAHLICWMHNGIGREETFFFHSPSGSNKVEPKSQVFPIRNREGIGWRRDAETNEMEVNLQAGQAGGSLYWRETKKRSRTEPQSSFELKPFQLRLRTNGTLKRTSP